MNVLKEAFLPEFLNRIDETIIFRPLGMEELTKIVDIQLRRLEGQLAEAGITIRITPEARRELADEGYDPAYGARPLKRVIQQRLGNRIASAMLSETIPASGQVEIGWDGDEFTLLPIMTSG
jgi:ATP-dependent Clp protease ATP-binding subunit ClpB